MSSTIIALAFMLFAVAGAMTAFLLGALWRDMRAISEHRRPAAPRPAVLASRRASRHV